MELSVHCEFSCLLGSISQLNIQKGKLRSHSFYSQNVLYSVVQQHSLLAITAIFIVLHLLVTMTKTAIGNIKM